LIAERVQIDEDGSSNKEKAICRRPKKPAPNVAFRWFFGFEKAVW
jgi:hypothetical protein